MPQETLPAHDDNPLCNCTSNLNDKASRHALYAAFASGDARFDGRVFVGVSSTGIYCRPVCTARMPKFENCTFYRSAAEAEAAGFRPCMICRPETAPGMAAVDAQSNLARRAAVLLREECASGESIERLAARLGYTDRHLRRAFEAEFDVTPVQYLQTCRLLLAKSLLTDSNLPIAHIAHAAGFSSVRRFNQLFKEHYRMTPSDLRKRGGKTRETADGITVRLGYRAPYRFSELLNFFAVRALVGVEVVTESSYARTARIPLSDGSEARGWVRVQDDEVRHALVVTMSESLLPCVSQVCARIRRQFDLDCNPQAVIEGIRSLDDVAPGAAVEGTRVPGCFEPFETTCRAILGQQVSVAAANRFAARVASSYGTSVDTPIDGLVLSFPTAAELVALDDSQGLEEAFGPLGIIRTRAHTIATLARMAQSGELVFGAEADPEEQMKRLLDVKGIGPWSANYIAMRTLCYPDAFLETDAGVAHALPDLTPKQRAKLAEEWRPWRSYANICLWNSLG